MIVFLVKERYWMCRDCAVWLRNKKMALLKAPFSA